MYMYDVSVNNVSLTTVAVKCCLNSSLLC